MKIKTTLLHLAMSLLFLVAMAAETRACNLSDLTFLSWQGPQGGPYTLRVRLCVGMGVTGSIKGGDQSTSAIFFAFNDATPGFQVLSFAPASITGPPRNPAGGPGCNEVGINYGADPYFGSDGEVIYNDPSYGSSPQCLGKPYGCVTTNAICGPVQAYCTNFTFVVNQIPDSLRAMGVEGGGNPVGGCYPNNDMLLDFSVIQSVTWGKLVANATSAGVNLSWTTLSETNSDYFVVERTVDGVNFEEIGQVAAAGSSALKLTYTYFDGQPSIGTIQYRIVQIDRSGGSFESNVVEIDYFTPAGLTWGVVGPNPCDAHLNLSFYSPVAETSSLFIFDATGKRMYAQDIAAIHGGNAARLDATSLLPGSYFLCVQGKDSRIMRKFIKQ